MNVLTRFLKNIWLEIVIIIAITVVLDHFIDRSPTPISADGKGYYEYLPSNFIRKDFVRNGIEISDSSQLLGTYFQGIYVKLDSMLVNKYPPGTAVLQAPFFFGNKLFNGSETDTGYEKSYVTAITYAAFFYLFLSLLVLKWILKCYNVKWRTVLIAQLLLVFGTNVFYYSTQDLAYSHIYAMLVIGCFALNTIKFFKFKRSKYFLYTMLFFGLAILIRNTNLILLLALIPFFAGSKRVLLEGFKLLFSKPKLLLLGVFIVISFGCFQLFVWYLQTGSFFIFSYGEESFNFLSPEITNLLFSYRKGLFVYTPILILSFLGLASFRNKRFLLFSWLFFFLFLTYFYASWWCWWYGASLGQRVFIDFYLVLFIPIALLFQNLKNVFFLILVTVFSLSAISLNLVQSYQYKKYILLYDRMTEEAYWQVFFKTGDRYGGMLWEKDYACNTLQKEIDIDAVEMHPNSYNAIDLGVLNFEEKVEVIALEFEMNFKESDESTIHINFKNLEKGHEDNLDCKVFHFSEFNFNTHKGKLTFDAKNMKLKGKTAVRVGITTEEDSLLIQNAKLLLY